MPRSRKRYVYLEVLRVVAIICVIFNHTGSRAFLRFGQSLGRGPFGVPELAASELCKVAVPCFLMVSGAVLLGKDEPIRVIWAKRLPRIVLVTLLASVAQYALICVGYYPGRSIAAPSIGNFFAMTYANPLIPPYWYLYIYMMFLIALPLLRLVARTAQPVHYRYLFGLQVAFQLLSSLIATAGHTKASPFLALPFLSQIVFYPLTGYALHNAIVDGRIHRRQLAAGALASVAALIVTGVLVVVDGRQTGDPASETYLDALVALPAATLFALVGVAFRHASPRPWLRRLLTTLGSCTFGVYIIDEITRQALVGPVVDALTPALPTFLATLAAVLLVWCVATVATWIGKQALALARKPLRRHDAWVPSRRTPHDPTLFCAHRAAGVRCEQMKSPAVPADAVR